MPLFTRKEEYNMLNKFIKKCYRILHFVGHKTIRYNFLIPKYVNGKKVKYGFVSNDYLEDPDYDEKLVSDLKEAGIKVLTYRVDPRRYQDYLCKAQYPKTYYGGGDTEGSNFQEKSLEHFVSADILDFTSDDTYIDIAASESPFCGIVQKNWNPKKVYRQDLKYKPGIHGDKIGGTAAKLPLPDNSISKATLHCSLEHFEGTSDMELFQEMERVLQPGGKLCVLPFYLAKEYTIHTDPIFDLFFGRNLVFDPEAQIRYCSWNNRHARHYDIEHLKTRIISNLKALKMSIFRVQNSKAVHHNCYLRFIGLFEK